MEELIMGWPFSHVQKVIGQIEKLMTFLEVDFIIFTIFSLFLLYLENNRCCGLFIYLLGN